MKDFSLSSDAREKREFVTRILCAPDAEEKLRDPAENGILKELLPEVYAMTGVTQPPEYHPEGDVFEHTMIMFRHMVFPDPLLGWSVLLHDVGKPLTRSVEESGRIRFFGHEEKGALLAEKILSRFEFDAEEAAVICHAVRNHMRFAHVTSMRQAKLERLMKEPFFGLELELHRLDCISCHGKMAGFDFLLGQYVRMAPPEPEKLLSGRDLLERGIKPGAGMGRILKDIRRLQLSGEISSREQALKYVNNLRKDEIK